MSKPNWKAITQYKCGCEIREIRLPNDPKHLSIAWCPKHEAALEMYEALRAILLSIPARSPEAAGLYQIGNNALAKAEGKK